MRLNPYYNKPDFEILAYYVKHYFNNFKIPSHSTMLKNVEEGIDIIWLPVTYSLCSLRKTINTYTEHNKKVIFVKHVTHLTTDAIARHYDELFMTDDRVKGILYEGNSKQALNLAILAVLKALNTKESYDISLARDSYIFCKPLNIETASQTEYVNFCKNYKDDFTILNLFDVDKALIECKHCGTKRSITMHGHKQAITKYGYNCPGCKRIKKEETGKSFSVPDPNYVITSIKNIDYNMAHEKVIISIEDIQKNSIEQKYQAQLKEEEEEKRQCRQAKQNEAIKAESTYSFESAELRTSYIFEGVTPNTCLSLDTILKLMLSKLTDIRLDNSFIQVLLDLPSTNDYVLVKESQTELTFLYDIKKEAIKGLNIKLFGDKLFAEHLRYKLD